MKRTLLFVATNIAVLLVLSISASILIRMLGIQEMPGGLNLQSLVIFAAVARVRSTCIARELPHH